MKAFVYLVFIFTTISTAYCQENFIHWNDKKPLQWKDFSGPVKDTSSFDAESFAEVRYTYTFNSLSDFTFNVNATFNKNTSWYKRESQSPSLLKHEQLHFDIAQLFAFKLKEEFENFQYSENFKEEISEIFNQKKLQYHLMQQQYDDETSHSINSDKQRQWEIEVHEELKRMKLKEDKKNSEQMFVRNKK